MQGSIYLMIVVMALCGLWFLWDVALKGLFLDMFREEMFKLRFELFEMAELGSISFSSDLYRTLETLLNGLLRYGHRFTFVAFLFSRREQKLAEREHSYVDVSSEIRLMISRVGAKEQTKLNTLLARVNTAVVLYMGATSLLFVCGFLSFLILRLLRIVSFSSRRDVGDVLEREAYREMQRQPQLKAA